MIGNIKSSYTKIGQILGSMHAAPSRAHVQNGLFVLGLSLLAAGITVGANAQGLETNFNDERIAGSVNAILTYIEGSFGALVMVSAGIGAILSSAFGQYRAALGCLVVAVGSFILRSVMGTFFNDINVQQ